MPRAKIVLLILAAVAAALLTFLHVPGLNGPPFFPWPWRRLPASPLYAAIAIAAIPFFAAQFIQRRTVVAFFLIMLSCFAIKLAIVTFRSDITGKPASLAVVSMTVEDASTTSYFTDAAALIHLPLRDWMSAFPDLMWNLHLHSATKPPGPILYWLIFIKLMGLSDRTALMGGLVMGAIATLSIPATYWMLKQLLADKDAAWCGASFLALCPGFVLFFPMFDPTYILLSTALIGLWFCALRDDRILFSASLGIVVAITGLISFQIFVIGLFMIGLFFFSGRSLKIGLKHAAITLLIAIALLGLIWIFLGYDPIATFAAAWRNQHRLLAAHSRDRLYPQTIFFDLSDFFMGAGWISLILLIFYFTSSRKQLPLAILAIAQLLVVAIAALLQSETARVWNFLLPLLMIPIGLELKSWKRGERIVCFVALALLTTIIYQNIGFLY
ncbi:MAG TPA: hypothetical protein VGF52_06420 [Tepidisphaeraceae bacterium]